MGEVPSKNCFLIGVEEQREEVHETCMHLGFYGTGLVRRGFRQVYELIAGVLLIF